MVQPHAEFMVGWGVVDGHGDDARPIRVPSHEILPWPRGGSHRHQVRSLETGIVPDAALPNATAVSMAMTHTCHEGSG